MDSSLPHDFAVHPVSRPIFLSIPTYQTNSHCKTSSPSMGQQQSDLGTTEYFVHLEFDFFLLVKEAYIEKSPKTEHLTHVCQTYRKTKKKHLKPTQNPKRAPARPP